VLQNFNVFRRDRLIGDFNGEFFIGLASQPAPDMGA